MSAGPPRVALDGHGRAFWLRGDGGVWRDDPPGWAPVTTIDGARGLAAARAGVYVLAAPGLHRLGAGNRLEPTALALDLAAIHGLVIVGGVPHVASDAGVVALEDAGPRAVSDRPARRLAARPDGRALYAADGATIVELDLVGGARTVLAELPEPITALAYTPAGLAAIAGGALHGVNLRQRRHVRIRALPEALAEAQLAAHHRGDLVLATGQVVYRCYGDGSDLRDLTPP